MKTKTNTSCKQRQIQKQKSKTHRKKSLSGGSPFFDATSVNVPLKSFIPLNDHNADLLGNQSSARLINGGSRKNKNKRKTKRNR